MSIEENKENNLPYSSVLEIECSKLVVICGQVAEDENEELVGDDIETQARTTLDNCIKQLKKVNCTLDDVFKVNVYISDLSVWDRFNQVYKTYFKNKPLPVRTTIQAVLFEGYLVEIEMWASKK